MKANNGPKYGRHAGLKLFHPLWLVHLNVLNTFRLAPIAIWVGQINLCHLVYSCRTGRDRRESRIHVLLRPNLASNLLCRINLHTTALQPQKVVSSVDTSLLYHLRAWLKFRNQQGEPWSNYSCTFFALKLAEVIPL